MVAAAAGGFQSDSRATEPEVTGEPRRTISPLWTAVIVGSIGLVITLASAWTAWMLDRHNEHRLLELQTRQAAAVLNSTVLVIHDPLSTALQIAQATGGDPGQFEAFMATYVGPGKLFASASLWKSDGSAV